MPVLGNEDEDEMLRRAIAMSLDEHSREEKEELGELLVKRYPRWQLFTFEFSDVKDQESLFEDESEEEMLARAMALSLMG